MFLMHNNHLFAAIAILPPAPYHDHIFDCGRESGGLRTTSKVSRRGSSNSGVVEVAAAEAVAGSGIMMVMMRCWKVKRILVMWTRRPAAEGAAKCGSDNRAIGM